MDFIYCGLRASCQLYDYVKCCSGRLKRVFNDDYTLRLALLDDDKMRCHIMNCVVALNRVQKQRMKNGVDVANEKYESVKRKVFSAAISMMIDIEFDSEQTDIKTILSAFPDESKMSDERSWLPMHFAMALSARNKISEDDVHILLSVDPLAMHRLSSKQVDEDEDEDDDDDVIASTGCTPAHILCMQKQPIISLVIYFCLRNPRAFVIYDQVGRCALHLVAQYSESLELLQYVLQINSKMTETTFSDNRNTGGYQTTPLGLLCRRLEFPTFDKMIKCLIEVDSSVEVISDGITNCFRSYDHYFHQDLSSGSRGERSLVLLGNLLDANPNVTTYDDSYIFNQACCNLRGELGIAVLTLLLKKGSTAVKAVHVGRLPIHEAATQNRFQW